MSELTFCKQFLTALDSRPIKLSSDHIADARQYPAQAVFVLPRLPHPPHPQRPNPKTDASSAATSTATLTVTLKPMKPTSPTIPLSNIVPTQTSVFDLKSSYSIQTSIPAAKIKILYKKKPVVDSKTVAEVIGQDAGAEVEFGVMVMGGAIASTPVTSPPAAAPSEAEKDLAGAAQEPSGKEVVETSEFWEDLKSFVAQRIQDEKEGQRLVRVFKDAWVKDK